MCEPVIVEELAKVLLDYGHVPISFQVRSVLDVQLVEQGLGGIAFSERVLDPAWLKNYDSYQDGGPARLAEHLDLTNWGILSAYADAFRAGGCVIAWDTSGIHMLEDRRDIAALWDIRIQPNFRQRHRVKTARSDVGMGRLSPLPHPQG